MDRRTTERAQTSRRRRGASAVIGTVVALLAPAVAAPAGAASTGAAPATVAAERPYRCSEQATWPPHGPGAPLVVEGDLLGDVTCDVADMVVRGDVLVAPGTHTNLRTSHVEGRVVARGAVDLLETTVRGDVLLTDGAGLHAWSAQVDGSVLARGSVILDASEIGGSLVATIGDAQPWFRVVSTRVAGDVVAEGGTMTVVGVDVGRRMVLARWDDLRICGGSTGRDLLLTAGAGGGAIGPDSCGGDGPRVGGSLLAVGVQPAATVRTTHVVRDVRCVAGPGLALLDGVTVAGRRDPACRAG